MSWANRNIPRKRDLSQIPEELRPTIIPRVQRPEVIISEMFHKMDDYKQDIKDKNDKNDAKNKEYINPRQHVTKKIDTSLKVHAYELYKDASYVFVILRNIRTVRDNDLWITAYNSIRKYYTNKIIIIDDNSRINTVDGKLLNTEIIKSEFNGAGEILPYYYFFNYKWADRMIFIHDSMFINREFTDSELEGNVKFHWHFNENKKDRKITQYISMLKNNKELQEYYNNPDSKWNGCFGAASIINLDNVIYLEEKYNIFSTLNLSIKTRTDREIFERVFGVVIYYEGMMSDSNFGEIIKYPGAFESNSIENAAYILQQKNYNTAIIKIWRGR